RGAVDFVAEHDVSENRAGLEMELAPAVGLGQYLGADDVRGHQVGGELDAFEFKPQRIAGGLAHQGLAEPWDAFDQDMAAGEQRGESFADDILMADDYL